VTRAKIPRCKNCRERLEAWCGEFCDHICEDAYWSEPEFIMRELDAARAELAKLQRRVEAAKQYATHHSAPLDRNRVIAILDGRGRYKRRDA
jgi:hypothetical protein